MRDEATGDRIIEIEFCSSTTTWEEIEDYATCIEGTMTCLEERGKDKLVGRIRLFYLDIGAIYDTNINVFDLFDIRGETEPFYSALIDHETGYLKSDVETIIGGSYARDCGVVALKCFPLQFEAMRDDPAWRRKMKFGKLSKDFERSLARLKKYYGALGFKALPGDDIMVAFAG